MDDRDHIGLDGWPCSFADSVVGGALIRAIKSLPEAQEVSDDSIETWARRLHSAAEWGRKEEEPNNRPASQAKTEKELRTLHDLCEKLLDHIERMHRPAVAAIFREGAGLSSLTRNLEEMKEVVRHAFGDFEAADSSRGAGRKLEAAYVSEMAALIFEIIARRRPTFTTDPLTGKVSGTWPAFLQDVFVALYIDASVASQVRALSEKKPPENHI